MTALDDLGSSRPRGTRSRGMAMSATSYARLAEVICAVIALLQLLLAASASRNGMHLPKALVVTP
jgi:hypothetical protein